MNIKGQALYGQMQAMATQARSLGQELKPLPAISGINGSQANFGNMLKDALGTVNGLQMQSRELTTAVELGKPGVSLAQAMIATQKSSLAFEATVQVRNKVVEAYKEIMAMPV